jgi:hypothetical protein
VRGVYAAVATIEEAMAAAQLGAGEQEQPMAVPAPEQ